MPSSLVVEWGRDYSEGAAANVPAAVCGGGIKFVGEGETVIGRKRGLFRQSDDEYFVDLITQAERVTERVP